ncbi:MAG: hypothetical protein WDO19_21135 [Bacteroidota bacterium]
MAKTISFFAHPCKYPLESNYSKKNVSDYTKNYNMVTCNNFYSIIAGT